MLAAAVAAGVLCVRPLCEVIVCACTTQQQQQQGVNVNVFVVWCWLVGVRWVVGVGTVHLLSS